MTCSSSWKTCVHSKSSYLRPETWLWLTQDKASIPKISTWYTYHKRSVKLAPWKHWKQAGSTSLSISITYIKGIPIDSYHVIARKIPQVLSIRYQSSPKRSVITLSCGIICPHGLACKVLCKAKLARKPVKSVPPWRNATTDPSITNTGSLSSKKSKWTVAAVT